VHPAVFYYISVCRLVFSALLFTLFILTLFVSRAGYGALTLHICIKLTSALHFCSICFKSHCLHSRSAYFLPFLCVCSKDISGWDVSVQFLYNYCVQLASRALQHQVTPLITMNLTLETKTALASGSTSRKNIVLQTDPTNLVHITQVLEEALRESQSQHSRQIQRSFK
jgi:hypothetical protein